MQKLFVGLATLKRSGMYLRRAVLLLTAVTLSADISEARQEWDFGVGFRGGVTVVSASEPTLHYPGEPADFFGDQVGNKGLGRALGRYESFIDLFNSKGYGAEISYTRATFQTSSISGIFASYKWKPRKLIYLTVGAGWVSLTAQRTLVSSGYFSNRGGYRTSAYGARCSVGIDYAIPLIPHLAIGVDLSEIVVPSTDFGLVNSPALLGSIGYRFGSFQRDTDREEHGGWEGRSTQQGGKQGAETTDIFK